MAFCRSATTFNIQESCPTLSASSSAWTHSSSSFMTDSVYVWTCVYSNPLKMTCFQRHSRWAGVPCTFPLHDCPANPPPLTLPSWQKPLIKFVTANSLITQKADLVSQWWRHVRSRIKLCDQAQSGSQDCAGARWTVAGPPASREAGPPSEGHFVPGHSWSNEILQQNIFQHSSTGMGKLRPVGHMRPIKL